MLMRLRYETGIATLVQLIVTTLLTFIGSIVSAVGGCTGKPSADCVSNTLVSLIYIILTVGALGFIAALGYVAQERRSRRLAMALITLEAFAALIYLFDTKQANSITDGITNLLSFLLAIWVITIAWRLVRAKGGRIVKTRTPQRHHKL